MRMSDLKDVPFITISENNLCLLSLDIYWSTPMWELPCTIGFHDVTRNREFAPSTENDFSLVCIPKLFNVPTAMYYSRLRLSVLINLLLPLFQIVSGFDFFF